MAQSFQLCPVLPSDGPAVARCLHQGFKDDGFMRASFPLISLEDRGKDLSERWLANFFAKEAVLMKAVDVPTGELVGYAKFEMPAELARSVKEKLFGAVPVPEEGTDLQQRDPAGLNMELAETMSEKIHACRRNIIGDRPRITFALVSVAATHRRQGIGSALLRWGTDIADQNSLPIWLDGSPMSVSLYRAFGFVEVGSVISNLSLGTSRGIVDSSYTHTCMLREPAKGPTSIS